MGDFNGHDGRKNHYCFFRKEKTTSQIIKMTKYGKPNIKASVLNGIIQLFYLSTWRFVHLNKKGKDKHWMC